VKNDAQGDGVFDRDPALFDLTAAGVCSCIVPMARNQWSRWGRGDCEGYGLNIGSGPVRFDAGVSRGVSDADGKCSWTSDINGKWSKTHAAMADGIARIEFELRQTGEQFVREYEGYKANRHKNKFSQTVDAARTV
jgi:hypothetical protein